MRRVVLLCGPPGAGKTTAARGSGLAVYDRDDPEWTSERHFAAALESLARNPSAQAVVIRTGATSAARARAANMVNATEVYLLMASESELRRRLARRGRADRVATVAGVATWFARFDRDDGVRAFPGWPDTATPDLGAVSDDW